MSDLDQDSLELLSTDHNYLIKQAKSSPKFIVFLCGIKSDDKAENEFKGNHHFQMKTFKD